MDRRQPQPHRQHGAHHPSNEVTSTNPSNLRGYTEVAGSKADVIIANPNGITCNGCGFINTSRGVLTTGTPVFGGDGSPNAFRVTGGNIAFQGRRHDRYRRRPDRPDRARPCRSMPTCGQRT